MMPTDDAAFLAMLESFVDETRERVTRQDDAMRHAIDDVKAYIGDVKNDLCKDLDDLSKRIENRIDGVTQRLVTIEQKLFITGNGHPSFHDRITELERIEDRRKSFAARAWSAAGLIISAAVGAASTLLTGRN